MAPDIVKAAMELAYRCCARQGSLITNQGMDRSLKSCKRSIRQIAPILSMVSIFVLHQQSGSPYTRDSFNAHWMKAKKAAAVKYSELDFNFTFHDLKAKGISDLEGTLSDKQAISGHKNATQTARYGRKIAVVPVVGGQK